MENLKMHTPDLAEENFKKLAAMFPNAVTETITGYDKDGNAITASVFWFKFRRLWMLKVMQPREVLPLSVM